MRQVYSYPKYYCGEFVHLLFKANKDIIKSKHPIAGLRVEDFESTLEWKKLENYTMKEENKRRKKIKHPAVYKPEDLI
jgi:hypothetical protein